jgi:hypothetical protein
MKLEEVIQAFGVTASLLWVLANILNTIRTWRGGSPELRIIKEQLVNGNNQIQALLQRILDRLEGR